MSATIETAIDYAITFGWSVLPLRGKVPDVGYAPRGLHNATRDLEVIHSWPDDANIGVSCRESGLLVIDVDERTGGHDSLHEFEATFGRLPDTPRAVTGGGGQHYVLRSPQRAMPKALRPGVDIKDRGYFVAPPSIHPATGRTYEWDIHPSEVPVAPVPDPWLNELVRGFRSKSTKYRDAGPIPVGRRNETLTSLAGSMRRNGLSESEILVSITEVNRRCVVPLPEAELKAIAKSIGRRAGGPPWVRQLDYALAFKGLTAAQHWT